MAFVNQTTFRTAEDPLNPMPVYARVDPTRRIVSIVALVEGRLGSHMLEEFVVPDLPPAPETVRHARDVLASHGWVARQGVFVEPGGSLLFDLDQRTAP